MWRLSRSFWREGRERAVSPPLLFFGDVNNLIKDGCMKLRRDEVEKLERQQEIGTAVEKDGKKRKYWERSKKQGFNNLLGYADKGNTGSKKPVREAVRLVKVNTFTFID